MSSTIKTFADFDVDSRLTQALTDQGITTPFPIQELTLPLALSGADLIGQARTGTGKTLAFGLPLLQRIDTSTNATQALIIVPTRELCLQVHDDLALAGSLKGVRVVAAYGGRAIDPQSQAIAEGAEVVVGTPGRLLDLMRRGLLQLSTVSTLVLDEADEMLDMGFLPDVEQLIEACAAQRQTLLFSATMPAEVVALARRYMRKPTFMRADVEESRIAPETRQHFFAVHRMDKPALVARILKTPERGRCVIFTRTKRMADVLVSDLREAGLQAAAIHSDLRQEARERTLARFRSGQIDVMCATEVAARGLDIDEVTHVVNYDCPDDEKMYLHRIGRTGRAGAQGVAVTLAIWNELARLDMIKKALDITEPTLEVFSTSDLLDELFPLPPQETAPADAADDDVDDRAPAREREGSTASSQQSRRRRRGGRGRGRRSDGRGAGADAAAGPGTESDGGAGDRAGAEAVSEDRTEAGSSPASTPATSRAPQPRRRTRRRTVGTEAGGRSDAPASAPAADDRSSGSQTERTRTRPSTADTEDRRQERSGGRRSGRRPAARDAAPRAAADGEAENEASDDAASSTSAAARGGAEDRPRGSRGGRNGGNRSSAARRGRRRGQRSSSSAPAHTDAEPRPVGAPSGTVDSTTARGEGRPGLRRLVKIDHLP